MRDASQQTPADTLGEDEIDFAADAEDAAGGARARAHRRRRRGQEGSLSPSGREAVFAHGAASRRAAFPLAQAAGVLVGLAWERGIEVAHG